jgi:hypothetical protein
MKQIFALLFLVWLNQSEPFCQPVNIMVKNIYCHEILDNGTETENKYPCIQKTYDNKNRLVLERFYDNKVRGQVGFRWFYYDTEGRVESIEHYNMDQLPEKLIQIVYGDSGDTLKITEYAGSKDTITKTSEKKYYYSSSGRLKQTKTITTADKLIETVKFSYKSGLKSPVKITKSNKSASPFKEKMTFVYADSTGLPQSAVRQVNDLQSKTRYSVMVSYNRKGNPVEELYTTAGKPYKKKVYKYAADIELEKYHEEDGEGKMTALFTVETYFNKANLNRKSYFK